MRADRLMMRWALRVLALVSALVLGLLWTGPELARAHFLLNLNVRILHVEHLDDGLRVYLRLPMPYLVADRLGPVAANGLPEPAPYTTNRMEDGQLVHYLDADALKADPLGLGAARRGRSPPHRRRRTAGRRRRAGARLSGHRPTVFRLARGCEGLLHGIAPARAVPRHLCGRYGGRRGSALPNRSPGLCV